MAGKKASRRRRHAPAAGRGPRAAAPGHTAHAATSGRGDRATRSGGTPDAASTGTRPRVGVLSLQGDFALHAAALTELGCAPVRVSLPEHLEALAALVLPGGESTTMLRLLESTRLRAPVERFVRERPVLGTCAGLILLAESADKLPAPTFGAIDITAARNAWGRQVHSFSDRVRMPVLGDDLIGVFIRAPRITRLGADVEVVAHYEGEAVGVRQGHVAAFAFHPELTPDRRLHAWFLREVAGLPLAAAR